jgi:hypothetical protein
MVEGSDEVTACRMKNAYYAGWVLENYLRLKEPAASTD